jgi:hypothetical protein
MTATRTPYRKALRPAPVALHRQLPLRPLQSGSGEWQNPMDATHALIPYSLLTTPSSFFVLRSFFLSPPIYALRAAARGGGRGGLASNFERRSLEH